MHQTPKHVFILTSIFIHGSFPKWVVEEHPGMAGESEGGHDDKGRKSLPESKRGLLCQRQQNVR